MHCHLIRIDVEVALYRASSEVNETSHTCHGWDTRSENTCEPINDQSMGQFESLAGNDMAPVTNLWTDNFLTLESGLLFMIENVLLCTVILACFAALSRMIVTCTCHLPKNNTDPC